jgi:hypothetical protein
MPEAPADLDTAAAVTMTSHNTEHKYFEDDEQLSFERLKGGDKQLAQLAAACPLLDVHLARLTKVVRGVCHESSGGGGAAGGGYSGRKRSWQECYGQECYGQDEEGSEGSGSEGSGSEEEEGFRKMQDVRRGPVVAAAVPGLPCAGPEAVYYAAEACCCDSRACLIAVPHPTATQHQLYQLGLPR